MGMAPTGKPVAISGIAILHISDGKVTEFHELFDQMGMMQQVGAMPSSQG
jgi:predicted ester cyclase